MGKIELKFERYIFGGIRITIYDVAARNGSEESESYQDNISTIRMSFNGKILVRPYKAHKVEKFLHKAVP